MRPPRDDNVTNETNYLPLAFDNNECYNYVLMRAKRTECKNVFKKEKQ